MSVGDIGVKEPRAMYRDHACMYVGIDETTAPRRNGRVNVTFEEMYTTVALSRYVISDS